MNHTERIHHVARQVGGLTREKARQAVELYLECVADELAHGEMIPLPSIGRVRVVIRKNSGRLLARFNGNRTEARDPGYRVQVSLRLTDELKARCHLHLDSTKPASTRIKAGEPEPDRTKPGLNPGSGNRKER